MKKTFLLILMLFIGCKSKETALTFEYKNQAMHDIKVDSVKVFSYGFPFISPVESERKTQEIKQNKISNVYQKYGLYKKDIGCVVNTKEDKSKKEYHKITNAYLEKRNGKGWRMKMENEIQNVNKNYR